LLKAIQLESLPPLSADQLALIETPPARRLFLEGPAGSGKTTTGAGRLLHLLQQGVPGEQILVLVPQRTLAGPYYQTLRRPDLPPGGSPSVLTLGGLAQRQIELFWPLVAAQAGFARPDLPPTFLTLETSQYYMARLVKPLLAQGYFDSVRIDPNRLYSQILDNLNKAAAVGFDHSQIGARLKAAWRGEPAQGRVYDEAQDCANHFRQFCLEYNLLDFSLQMEVFVRHLWPSLLCRQYLQAGYRHLICDNLEEDVPVTHDVLLEWLPHFESALLIADSQGGFRSFLGADPLSAERLKDACEQVVTLSGSWCTSPNLQTLDATLEGILRRQPAFDPDPQRLRPVFQIDVYRYTPEMTAAVCDQVTRLVLQGQVPPDEIVILAPFLSDSLRFALMTRLEQAGIPARSHRPSRSLREEPATLCLLTLARLAHPAWRLPCTRHDIRYMLMQTIDGLDLVRADLLAQMLFSPKEEEGLRPFDPVRPEMQERITYTIGQRYETLRAWLSEYRRGEPVELDVFLSRLFGEVLSQPGFGFHTRYDAAAVTARLIESVQKFRWVTEDSLRRSGLNAGQEYLQMVEEGVVAAQYLQSWVDQPEGAVLLAPAYTFLMYNRPASYQFWLDIGSQGWAERLLQPLTHPYVLSRSWDAHSGRVWSEADELAAGQEMLARLSSGLIRRCRSGVFLCVSGVNEQGNEQRGPLLRAVQTLLKRLAAVEGNHV